MASSFVSLYCYFTRVPNYYWILCIPMLFITQDETNCTMDHFLSQHMGPIIVNHSLFTNSWYIYIYISIEVFLSILDCEMVDENLVHSLHHEMDCFSFEHSMIAIFAILGLILFITFSLLIALLFFESYRKLTNISATYDSLPQTLNIAVLTALQVLWTFLKNVFSSIYIYIYNEGHSHYTYFINICWIYRTRTICLLLFVILFLGCYSLFSIFEDLSFIHKKPNW